MKCPRIFPTLAGLAAYFLACTIVPSPCRDDDLAGAPPDQAARRRGRARVVPGPRGVPARAGGDRAAGDRPGERLLRRRRPALRRRDAGLSLPRGHARPATSACWRIRDGDGTFDTSTIFVDGLSWPTSVVPYDGGVFIAVAPDILYAKDTDGDGVADVKKVMFTRLRHPERPGAVERPALGTRRLDLRRRRRQRRRDQEPDPARRQAGLGPGPRLPVQARRLGVRGDLRRRPVRPRLRRLGPSLHLQQQQPHPPDRPARRATSSATPRWWSRRSLDDIAAEGAAAPVFRISPAEPWRVVRTRQRAADPAMSQAAAADRAGRHRLLHLGHRRDDLSRRRPIPPEYRGNAFIGDVGGNLVHRKVLTKNGAEFLRDPGRRRRSSSSPRPTTGSGR